MQFCYMSPPSTLSPVNKGAARISFGFSGGGSKLADFEHLHGKNKTKNGATKIKPGLRNNTPPHGPARGGSILVHVRKKNLTRLNRN